jgi:hypothetical protein
VRCPATWRRVPSCSTSKQLTRGSNATRLLSKKCTISLRRSSGLVPGRHSGHRRRASFPLPHLPPVRQSSTSTSTSQRSAAFTASTDQSTVFCLASQQSRLRRHAYPALLSPLSAAAAKPLPPIPRRPLERGRRWRLRLPPLFLGGGITVMPLLSPSSSPRDDII